MKVWISLLSVALALAVDASPAVRVANAVAPSPLPQTTVSVTAGEADAATPQIEDSALALLEKSQTTMRNLKTYYAESWTAYTYPLDPDDQPQPNRDVLEIMTAEKPNHLRVEVWEMTSLDNGTWVKKTVDPAIATVCDGKTLWEQQGKQYHAEPFTDIDSLLGSSLQYGFFEGKFSPYSMAKSSRAAGILQKLWRQGSDIVEGKLCEKVSRRIESAVSAREKETVETTWYIDADGLVRRKVETLTLPKRLGLSYTVDSTLRVLRVNATITNPEKRFTYVPPKDVKYSEKIALNLPKPIDAGTSAPDFAATRPDGTAVKLSDFRGKVVLLCFCASWSASSSPALTHFQEVAQTLQASNIPVVVLAVDNSEEQAPFLAWVKAHPELSGITFAYADPKVRSINSLDYNVLNIPTMYAIDREGIVRAHSTSYTDVHDGVEAVLRAAAVPMEK